MLRIRMRGKASAVVICALACCVLVAVATWGHAMWVWRPPVPVGDHAALEQHLVATLTRSEEAGDLASGVLVLVRDGQVRTARGFGRDATGARVDPEHTLFRVASVSKAVTAWGVLRLVQDGHVDLDTPVVAHLRRWRFPGSSDAFADRVTVRHLLSHTAGLDDGLGYGGFPEGRPLQTLEASLESPLDSTVGPPRPARVTRAPGIAMAYSGAGYTVLQLLVEDITGRSFATHMRQAVLQPLRMRHADFDWDAIGESGRAHRLAANVDRDGRPRAFHRYTATAASSLYASGDDVAQFALALCQAPTLLGADLASALVAAQPGTDGSWGLGVARFTPDGGRAAVIGHDGATVPSWGAILRVAPDTCNALVLLVSGTRLSVSTLGDAWVYTETGVVTAAARRQTLYNNLPLAAGLATAGVVVSVVSLRARRGKGAGGLPAS